MALPEAEPSPRLMGHRPFALFWWSRVLTIGAYHMQAVAIGWLVYDLTGSALDLGLVGLIQFVPVVVLTLLVGHLADRYDRRLIIRVTQLVNAMAAVLLAAGSYNGWLTREFLFATVFVVGTARAFETPTWLTMLPSLVPPPLIPRAVAGSATANQCAIIGGPALGGLIYAAGPAIVFSVCCVAFAIGLVMLSLVRAKPTVQDRQPLTLKSLFAGVSFIRSRRLLFGVITLDMFAILLGGATALLPIYAKDILGTGPVGLGLLRSAPAVGALVASILLARYPIKHSLGRIMFAAVALFGISTTLFAVSTSFPLSLITLVVLGASDAVSVVIRFALVQVETPDPMLGRVSAINGLFTGTSNTLGDFRAGLTAAWFGTVPSVLIGGIGTIVVALLWMKLFPELREIKEFKTRT